MARWAVKASQETSSGLSERVAVPRVPRAVRRPTVNDVEIRRSLGLPSATPTPKRDKVETTLVTSSPLSRRRVGDGRLIFVDAEAVLAIYGDEDEKPRPPATLVDAAVFLLHTYVPPQIRTSTLR